MRNETNYRTKGTVLVMVVVLVALLGIMASMFVLNTRITLRAVQNQVGGTANQGQVNQKEVELSTDSVIAQIQSTLAEDLWGRPEDPNRQDDAATPGVNEKQQAMNNLRLLGLPANSTGTTNATVVTNNNTNLTTIISGNPYRYSVNEPWDAPVRFLPPAATLQTNFFYYNTGWQIANNVNVDGDPWLASMGPNGGVWPQGSDLFLVKFTNAGNDYWPMFGAVSIFQNIPYESVTAPTQNWYPETYADADGDGFFDSVWLYQKGFFNEITNAAHITYADGDVDDPNPNTPNSAYYNGLVADLPIKSTNPAQAYRMAVRIVDTSGMVNVNTAWQVPSDLPAASNSLDRLNQFLGNVPSGVNLYGCAGSSTSTAYTYTDGLAYSGTALPGKSQEPTFQDLLYLQNSYVMRIENPNWSQLKGLSSETLNSTKELAKFSPLDTSDEMELRYRWFSPGIGYVAESLDPGNRSTLETYFPQLDGGTAGGKIPDSNSDNKFTNSDTNYATVLANIQKRTRLTAYSFSRNIRTTPMNNTEMLANFDGRMKNLGRAVWALVYRVKDAGAGGADQFPYATWIDSDPTLDAAQKVAARSASRTANESLVRELVRTIYNSFLTDNDPTHYADGLASNTVPADQTRYAIYHTWQYIANLVDYLDEDNEPTDLDTTDAALQTALGLTGAVDAAVSFNNNSHVYGLEKHAVISEVVVNCENYIPTDTTLDSKVPGDTVSPAQAQYSVFIEQHNPWNEPVSAAQRVKVFFLTDETGKNGMNGLSDVGLAARQIPAQGWVNVNPTPANPITNTTTITLEAVPALVEGSYSAGTSFHVRLAVVTYFDPAGTIPEDIFITTADLPAAQNVTYSFERNFVSLASPWSTMANSCVRNATPGTRTNPAGSLNAQNQANGALACCGYATVTTGNTAARRLADVWCDPAIGDLWNAQPINLTAGNSRFAKIRNWGDLLVVPYVGYCRMLNGEYRGIGDWVLGNDNGLRFDLTETGAAQKGTLLREGLLTRYTILNREDDELRQLNVAAADTINEMRLPGLINVNTAPAPVLNALHPLANTASGVINTAANKPYKSTNHFLTAVGMPVTADINILNLSSTAAAQDVLQQQGLFTRIANLITTRSDTFVAYIYVQSLDKDGKVIASRREVALFDRSLCNEPPLIAKFDNKGTPDPADDVFTKWEPNPAYRPVKVVARQVVN